LTDKEIKELEKRIVDSKAKLQAIDPDDPEKDRKTRIQTGVIQRAEAKLKSVSTPSKPAGSPEPVLTVKKLTPLEQAKADAKESNDRAIAQTKETLKRETLRLSKIKENEGSQTYSRDLLEARGNIKKLEDRIAALENPHKAAAEAKTSGPAPFKLKESQKPVGSGLGGKLKGHQVNKFVEASYKKLDDAHKVDDYELDKELSTKNNKVYRDPSTGKVVIANAGTSSLTDWWNNKNILFGNYSKTKRYKEVEDTQKKAIQKYGKDNIMNVGHSQSGEALRIMKRNGLLGEAVAVNPAIIGKSTEDIDVIRSNRDLVSLLTPTSGKDTTIQAQSYNPLTEHSSNIISGANEEKEFGRGFRIKHRNC
jgi:hypothetical protein